MEDRIKEILRALEREAQAHPHSFILSSRRHYVHLLYDALSDEGREEFENTKIGCYLHKRQELIQESENRKFKELNRSIEEVLEDFRNPKSGQRQKSRKDLYERFSAQQWQTQVKILETMLEVGTLTDITWVIEQVRSSFRHQLYLISHNNEQWLQDFKQKLHDGCCKYLHNPKIANYLIETSDQSLIMDNLHVLENAVGYYKIALTLAHLDRTYKIERAKLDFFQYLDILSKSDRPIKKADLWQEFIVWLLSLEESRAQWIKPYKSYTGTSDPYDSTLSLLDLRQVDWMVKTCKKMKLFDVVCAIYDLDSHIRTLVETIPMKHYDYEHYEKNCKAFLTMAKTIAWEYQPNLLPDVTVESCINKVLEKIGVWVEKFEGYWALSYGDKSCYLHFDQESNNYYFSCVIEEQVPLMKDEFSSLLTKANLKHHRQCTGVVWDGGSKVKSEIFHVPHQGLTWIIFKSELNNFFRFCDYFKELTLNF